MGIPVRGKRSLRECVSWKLFADILSQVIPKPISFADYDQRDPVQEVAFSSWAYLLDIFRIIGELVLPRKLYHGQPWHEEVTRVETKIADWVLSIPKWKMDAVDAAGAPDMVLLHGLIMAHRFVASFHP